MCKWLNDCKWCSNLRQVQKGSCWGLNMFDESRLKTCKWWSTFSRLYCSQSLVWYRWVLAASSGNTRAQASVLTWKSVCIMCIEYELGLLCTKCTSSRLAASQSQRSLILPFYSWKKKPRSLNLDWSTRNFEVWMRPIWTSHTKSMHLQAQEIPTSLMVVQPPRNVGRTSHTSSSAKLSKEAPKKRNHLDPLWNLP
jgi:hypothetical protein